MPEERLELSWVAPHDFESCAYTIPPFRHRPSIALCEGGLRSYNTPAMAKKQKILIIVGPTASGKSALAVELARKFGGEIISADSRQVYKGLDMGTGKITKREMKNVPHHLLDVASPKKNFSAGDYVRLACKAADMIYHINHLPVVVGGTGFYIDALVGRIALPDVPPNKALRLRLAKKTVAQLFAILKKKDPRRARAMATPSERNNKIRLIRALEIARFQRSGMMEVRPPSFDVFWIGVRPEDAELRKRINIRLRERLGKGMIGEAKKLHAKGLSFKRMEELGLEYRSLARHLRGDISRKEMQEELQSDIWRYSRKQIGYWRRNKEIKWFEPKEKTTIEKTIRVWLRK